MNVPPCTQKNADDSVFHIRTHWRFRYLFFSVLTDVYLSRTSKRKSMHSFYSTPTGERILFPVGEKHACERVIPFTSVSFLSKMT